MKPIDPLRGSAWSMRGEIAAGNLLRAWALWLDGDMPGAQAALRGALAWAGPCA